MECCPTKQTIADQRALFRQLLCDAIQNISPEDGLAVMPHVSQNHRSGLEDNMTETNEQHTGRTKTWAEVAGDLSAKKEAGKTE